MNFRVAFIYVDVDIVILWNWQIL